MKFKNHWTVFKLDYNIQWLFFWEVFHEIRVVVLFISFQRTSLFFFALLFLILHFQSIIRLSAERPALFAVRQNPLVRLPLCQSAMSVRNGVILFGELVKWKEERFTGADDLPLYVLKVSPKRLYQRVCGRGVHRVSGVTCGQLKTKSQVSCVAAKHWRRNTSGFNLKLLIHAYGEVQKFLLLSNVGVLFI